MIFSLSEPTTTRSSLDPNPAEEISKRYRLSMSPVWCDWFNGAAHLESELGEFNQPVDPQELLESRPGFIWPGFMLPDTLPVLGNGYGDWLCLRVTESNTIGEVIHWYHGGGDWMPWGTELCEAIAFDRLRPWLAGRRVGHSIRPGEPMRSSTSDALAQWAAEQLPHPIATWLIDPQQTPLDAWPVWLAHDVASTAMRGELALAALDGKLRQKFRADIARRLGLHWETEAVRWMFDESLLDGNARHAILESLQLADEDLDIQDWDTACKHCEAVSAMRSDLGWCWDLQGWIAERKGKPEQAVAFYLLSMQTSSFSDQSIRFRTHWFPEHYGKFAAYRLHELQQWVPKDQSIRSWLELYWQGQSQSLRRNVTGYWIEQADRWQTVGNHTAEYQSLYRAGWDLGCEELANYTTILNRMALAAEASGQLARASVAATHAACLVKRDLHR